MATSFGHEQAGLTTRIESPLIFLQTQTQLIFVCLRYMFLCVIIMSHYYGMRIIKPHGQDLIIG